MPLKRMMLLLQGVPPVLSTTWIKSPRIFLANWVSHPKSSPTWKLNRSIMKLRLFNWTRLMRSLLKIVLMRAAPLSIVRHKMAKMLPAKQICTLLMPLLRWKNSIAHFQARKRRWKHQLLKKMSKIILSMMWERNLVALLKKQTIWIDLDHFKKMLMELQWLKLPLRISIILTQKIWL